MGIYKAGTENTHAQAPGLGQMGGEAAIPVIEADHPVALGRQGLTQAFRPMDELEPQALDQQNGGLPRLPETFVFQLYAVASSVGHEQKVTTAINNIYAAAYELKDFRTMQLLDWFVKEQNEEEKNTESIVKKYDLFGNDSKGLYMLDNELATRVYSAPTLTL